MPPSSASETTSEPTFAQLWRAALDSHRHLERWRAVRLRSAVAGLAALLGLIGHGLAGSDPETPRTAADEVVGEKVPDERVAALDGAVAEVAAAGNGAEVRARNAPAGTDVATLSRVPPVPVIFDSDVVNSIDDSLALAMLHGYEARGMVDLLAVTVSLDEPRAVPYVDAIGNWYDNDDVPIGVIGTGSVSGGRDAFHRQVVGGQVAGDSGGTLDAGRSTALTELRRALAGQRDRSVVVVATGFATNLAQLLGSPPDGISPLSGRELVAAKVRLLAVTAGDFTRAKPEHNTARDPASARLVFAQWPTPVVATEWQIGADLPFPGGSLGDASMKGSPLLAAAVLYGRNSLAVDFPYDPPSFDPATVLYAVEPDAYFSVGDAGHITLDDQLITRFEPDLAGRHRLIQRPLEPGTRSRITNRYAELVRPIAR